MKSLSVGVYELEFEPTSPVAIEIFSCCASARCGSEAAAELRPLIGPTCRAITAPNMLICPRAGSHRIWRG